MRSRFWRQSVAVLRKDLRRELRTKEVTLTTSSFAALLVLVFTFSFYRDPRTAVLVAPGILWVAILFAGTLAIGRSFLDERESGCLRALALIPGTESSLYAGKLASNLCFMVVFEATLVPFIVIAFDLPWTGLGTLFWGAIALGTIGFAGLGTLFGAMLVHHRLREALIPLLLYPLLIPLLIAGVQASASAAADDGSGSLWLWFLAGLALIYVCGSYALFGRVLRAIE